MAKGINPREILADLGVEKDQIPEYVDDVAIWKIIIEMLAEPPRRNKLRHVNTLDDVVRLLRGKLRASCGDSQSVYRHHSCCWFPLCI